MRLMIAEDSVLLREGLTGIFTRFGCEVVAAVGSADELLRVIARDLPDVVVVDVRMPPSFHDEGLRAAIQLRGEHPRLGILVLSQFVEAAAAGELLEAGTRGVGYLLKDRIGAISQFVEAVREVAAGGTVIDPDVVHQLLVHHRAHDPLDALSPREREVLALVAEGRSNSAIAQRLYVSEAAVAKHVTGVYTKLNLGPDADDHRRVLAALTFLRSR
ncbi:MULTISPECIES: response regulator transcription factor [unclassified Nonomuraea]|uniref:response regulator transcription factor n=1 Tax=unclassified Nonomuraea TaxID=2593643 RepID=UPI0033E284A6